MELKNYEMMEKFDLNHIPDLDICILGALELFSRENLKEIKVPFKRPLVVGSGNAGVTGKIMFENKDAIFASESNFEFELKTIKNIDGVVLISASGEKHAPVIAKMSKKQKKKVILITNNPESEAVKFSDQIFLFPKQREPYTYNTSTYLGMILGHTREDPKKIYNFIKKNLSKRNFSNLKKFDKYYFVVPIKFYSMIRMLDVKFIELFGRKIARDIETSEAIKHATTVVPSKELFVVFGDNKVRYGKHQINVPLPKNASYGAMMSIAYYFIGKIQKSKPAWFKQNIANYVKEASKVFGYKIEPIVE